MLELGKKKFVPPRYEAFIEDDGDGFQVSLIEDGVQIGGAWIDDDGAGGGFDRAKMVAADWIANGGMGA